ncbi:hypothetical protein BU23DRAFT_223533 [Bimuria novae-zelandiae CBS 107.79]|uniref:Uncharacterized protein n=1 Tax=Bimuria novae-zelandiae CBS 107.79 TaxID=1447943 RepID=A0A6A5VNW2_9PLEO|nr:hypothetical protein BU23DRAFT_223533 [Bimuria novae-zelandiae CBS 107.79]
MAVHNPPKYAGLRAQRAATHLLPQGIQRRLGSGIAFGMALLVERFCVAKRGGKRSIHRPRCFLHSPPALYKLCLQIFCIILCIIELDELRNFNCQECI